MAYRPDYPVCVP